MACPVASKTLVLILAFRGESKRMSIESVLKSAGIEVFRSVDAFRDKAVLAAALRECLESDELAVLLVTEPCPNLTGKVC